MTIIPFSFRELRNCPIIRLGSELAVGDPRNVVWVPSDKGPADQVSPGHIWTRPIYLFLCFSSTASQETNVNISSTKENLLAKLCIYFMSGFGKFITVMIG